MTSKDSMDYAHVLQLIDLLEASSTFSEVRLRSGDFEIELRRGSRGTAPAPVESQAPAPAQPVRPAVAEPAAAADPAAFADPAPQVAAPSRTAPARGAWPAGHRVVQAPMVGTGYRAPAPGARPFVEVGQAVSPGDTLCIVEVMKLMNSIPCDCEGVVVEILFEDGQALAHGQDLIVVAPR